MKLFSKDQYTGLIDIRLPFTKLVIILRKGETL